MQATEDHNRKRPSPDPSFVLRGTGGGVTSIDFCVRGSPGYLQDTLVTGNADGTINLWDLVYKRPVESVTAHKGSSVLFAKILRDGKLLSHGRDGKVNIWSIEEGQELNNSTTVSDIGFCPISLLEIGQNDWIAYPSTSDSQEKGRIADTVNVRLSAVTVNVVCLQTGEEICKLQPKDKLGMVMNMKLFKSEDSSKPFGVIGYENGAVHLWDITAGKELGGLKVHDEPVMCLDLDNKQKKIATGSATKTLSVVEMDTKSGNPLQQIYTCDVKQPGIASVRVRDDCQIVAAGGWDGSGEQT